MRSIIAFLLIAGTVLGQTTLMTIQPDGSIYTTNGFSLTDFLGVSNITHSTFTIGGEIITVSGTTVFLDKTLYWVEGEPYIQDPEGIPGELISYAFPDMPVTEPTTNYPVSFAAFSPTVTNATPSVEAVEISEWTRQNDPGDTMALTGENLTNDYAHFLIYSTNGIVAAEIQRIDGRTAAITLPETLPENEMYLMWPMNENGFGHPVAINQTELWWLGFDTVSTGDVFYAYGESLVQGDGSAWLYCVEEDQWIESTTNANQYKAEFIVPSSWANGTNTIYAHNGRGGKYGWSEPQELIVQDKFVWGTNVYNVVDYGADGSDTNDDTTAVLAANTAASGKGTLYFPAGTYYVTNTVYAYARTKYIGAGKDLTFLAPHPSQTNAFNMFSGYSGAENVYVSDMTFQLGHNPHTGPVSTGGKFWFTFENCDFLDSESDAYVPKSGLVAGNSRYVIINDCTIAGRTGANLGAGNLRVNNCTFKGRADMTMIASISGAFKADVSNCTIENYDASDTSSGEGWAKGRWLVTEGAVHDLYINGNETINLGPRHPTVFYGPSTITNISAYADEQYIPLFGTYGKQELAVTNIPAALHDMVPPEREYRGTTAYIETVVGGVTNEIEHTVWQIDATNNIVTVLSPSYSTIPTSFTSATVWFKNKVDQNSGEQILFEGVVARFSGYPAAVTSNTVTFANTNDLNHASVYNARLAAVCEGAGFGQSPRIADIDVATGVVTLEDSWRVVPDTNSLIHLGAFCDQIVIYDNVFDGRPENYSTDIASNTATTALNVYGGASRVVFANNEVTDLTSGIALFAEGNDDLYTTNSLMPQIFFNTVEGNTIHGAYTGIGIFNSLQSYEPAYDSAATHVGNVFRANVVTGIIGNVVSYIVESPEVTPVQLNVWQDNVFTNSDTSICVLDAEGVVNQVLINNFISGGNGGVGYKIGSGHYPAQIGNTWTNFTGIFQGTVRGELNLPIRYAVTNGGTTDVVLQNQGAYGDVVYSVVGTGIWTNYPNETTTISVPSTTPTNFAFATINTTQLLHIVDADYTIDSGGYVLPTVLTNDPGSGGTWEPAGDLYWSVAGGPYEMPDITAGGYVLGPWSKVEIVAKYDSVPTASTLWPLFYAAQVANTREIHINATGGAGGPYYFNVREASSNYKNTNLMSFDTNVHTFVWDYPSQLASIDATNTLALSGYGVTNKPLHMLGKTATQNVFPATVHEYRVYSNGVLQAEFVANENGSISDTQRDGSVYWDYNGDPFEITEVE